jgi:hypothetical protein
MNFVDMALHAVFGMSMDYIPIGTTYSKQDEIMTTPNQFEGNYFVPGQPEGRVLILGKNSFYYPHPSMQLTEFLGKPPI